MHYIVGDWIVSQPQWDKGQQKVRIAVTRKMLASTPLVIHFILMPHVAEREFAPVAKNVKPNVSDLCAAQDVR